MSLTCIVSSTQSGQAYLLQLPGLCLKVTVTLQTQSVVDRSILNVWGNALAQTLQLHEPGGSDD